MLINEICSIVGLSRKSIRYYEDEGLLNPTRNQNNDYRMYTEEDIKTLKIIKFLRELNVSINDIKKLKDNSLSLNECMMDRINKIEEEEKNYKKIKNLCLEIIDSQDNYSEIDITKYLREVNILNKKGFTMRDVKTNKKKKIFGAVISSLIFSLFFIFMIGLFTYIQFFEKDSMPWVLYGIMVLLFGTPLIGIIGNLVQRIKEIKGGEEDEASKY